jgi:hypothetical protein
MSHRKVYESVEMFQESWTNIPYNARSRRPLIKEQRINVSEKTVE